MRFQNYLSILPLACACALPIAAHADTTYNITGTFSDVAGSTLGGTYTINAAGVITAADLTLDGMTFDFMNGSSGPIDGFTTYSYAYVETAPNSPDEIDLEIYDFNTVCSAQTEVCTFFGSPQLTSASVPPQQLNLISGSASLAATPEPSTLLLLGTGILGIAGQARRRFLKK